MLCLELLALYGAGWFHRFRSPSLISPLTLLLPIGASQQQLLCHFLQDSEKHVAVDRKNTDYFEKYLSRRL